MDNSLQPPADSRQQRREPYKFSDDEVKVINQCAHESMLYRSFPFAAIAGLAIHAAVKGGYLKPNPKYGSIPKACAAAAFGYFMGKISYLRVCEDRLVQLPDSQLGAALRARRAGKSGLLYNNLTPNPSLVLAPFQSAVDGLDDDRQSDALNLDTERPTYSGLNDTFRPSLEGGVVQQNIDQELNIQTPKVGTTYDELRRRNRDEYTQRNKIPIYQAPPPDGSSNNDISGQQTRAPASAQLPPAGPKNKYGDTWSS